MIASHSMRLGKKMEKKHFPLFCDAVFFFFDEKSSFDSLMSVIDPESDI
jgi:hypothetical protein